MLEVQTMIVTAARSRHDRVRAAREQFSVSARALHTELAEARAIARAVEAVTTQDDLVADIRQRDADTRELVAETAALFVDRDVSEDEEPDLGTLMWEAADACAAVVVAGDGPPIGDLSTTGLAPWLQVFEEHLVERITQRRMEVAS